MLPDPPDPIDQSDRDRLLAEVRAHVIAVSGYAPCRPPSGPDPDPEQVFDQHLAKPVAMGALIGCIHKVVSGDES